MQLLQFRYVRSLVLKSKKSTVCQYRKEVQLSRDDYYLAMRKKTRCHDSLNHSGNWNARSRGGYVSTEVEQVADRVVSEGQ